MGFAPLLRLAEAQRQYP